MNYLIIGGNSDIAKDVIQRLTENGHAIHALVRSEEQAEQLKALGHTATIGDATKEAYIKKPLEEAGQPLALDADVRDRYRLQDDRWMS